MQFLKMLFWCLLAFIAAVFTIGNWQTVPIRLWGGLIADTNLPLLLLVTFLIGWLPTLLYHQAIRWRLKQRLATSERALADLRAPRPEPVYPSFAADPLPVPATAPVPETPPTSGTLV